MNRALPVELAAHETAGRHGCGQLIGAKAFYAERDAAYYRLVRSWTELLTKRRAVDFCRVATALCRTA
jgi:hypothetical protein